ncbi:MAG: hypothetical protein V1733_02890 [bacterium]
MRKTLALGLLLVILLNSMGYYVIFELNRYIIRKEMRGLIGTGKKISMLEITDPGNDKNFRWVDTHEILVHGRLYDVIYTSQRGTKTLYYCYRDVKEEKLISAFHRANNSKLTQALWHMLSKIVVTFHTLRIDQVSPVSYSYPQLICKTCSVFLPPGNPPPRMFL